MGKWWTFDSLSLRTPTAQFKNVVLTTFVEKACKYTITFAHKHQTTEEYTNLNSRLRAKVRPYHGEIQVLRHDAHPSFARTSHQYVDF